MNKNHERRPDVYTRVTDRIVALLEEGILPWEPAHLALGGMPRNLHSGNSYRGINAFLLGSLQYGNPWFVTYRQARALGGQVRKGERGYVVVKYGEARKSTEEEEEESRNKPLRFLRSYTVFHAPSQTEGLTIPEAPRVHPEYHPSEKRSRVERLVQDMPSPPEIREGVSAMPSYSVLNDRVDMPGRKSFLSEDAFYKTLFHELGHATGHESRLARPSLLNNEGIRAARNEARKTYCMEELVAEMTSAYLAAHVGIQEKENEWDSAAYIGGWLQALGQPQNRHWVVRAAGQAQRASDYILGTE